MNKKPRILLIDDEIEFITTLAERLELRGYDVETSESGESGIDLMAKSSFDVAILDLMMPGLNGIDTLNQIKRIDPRLPVILLTGHGSTKEGMEGMRIGAFDFLMKPLDINELLDRIKLALEKGTKEI
ncbi:response regulator [Desulfospira joergensenii]|uniref:response regulator n=1 Tax=Desulfospira joergensenii TaxID=53329 RepID=UPI0003B31CE8|nr:response regulator [Desulfospira joergensenii]